MLRPLAPTLTLVLLVVSCTVTDPASDQTASRSPTSVPGVSGTIGEYVLNPGDSVRTTSGDQSGNRVTAGALDLAAEPLRIELGVEPRWIVGGGVGDEASVFVVVAEDGSVTVVTVDGAGPSVTELGSQDPATPPVVVFGAGGYRLISPPVGASPLTAPAIVDSSIVSVTLDGEVSVATRDSVEPVDVNGLGDSRLVVDERGLVAVLSDPTGEYAHGVVGDRVESATVTIFEPVTGGIVGVATAPDGTVFETVAPMWADVDGDGDSELLVTASDAGEGGRLVVYDERGDLVASSAPIGRGQRWRNQLGVAVFDSAPTIVDVQTPHIGGIVQWFRLDGETLERLAEIGEYSSHRIGRRNLDQGVIVDGDGDGRLDVLVPSQNQQSLAALALETGEASEIRSVPLGARLSSNLSAFEQTNGRASLALGLEDGSLLIWP